MVRGRNTSLWIELALFVAAGVFLYQMGGVFLFMIPLQIIYARRGRILFSYAAVGMAVVIAGIRLVGMAGSVNMATARSLVFLELFVVAILVAGLALLNLFPQPRIRRTHKLLITTGGAACLIVPLILWLRSQPEITQVISDVYRQLADSMTILLSQSLGTSEETLRRLIDPDEIVRLAGQVLFRSFLFTYFLLLTFSWWAGTRAAARSIRPASGVPALPPARLVDLFLPDLYVWPLIGSLALILLDFVFKVDLGVLAYAGWNVGMIFLFLYALQGLGIAQFFFRSRNVGRGLRFLFYAALVVLLLTPKLNIALIIALPGLGVSEIWLQYRTRTRSDQSDEDHTQSGR